MVANCFAAFSLAACSLFAVCLPACCLSVACSTAASFAASLAACFDGIILGCRFGIVAVFVDCRCSVIVAGLVWSGFAVAFWWGFLVEFCCDEGLLSESFDFS